MADTLRARLLNICTGLGEMTDIAAEVLVDAMLDEFDGGWLPIDTAPQDGTDVDLWAGVRWPDSWWGDGIDDDGAHRPGWNTSCGGLGNQGFMLPGDAATHWRPRPPPPTGQP